MAVFMKFPCAESATGAAPKHRPANPAWTLLAATVATSMSQIDGTAVNVALPVLQRDFNASAAALQWVIEGYSLFLSALILIGGSLGDIFGRRRIFGLGVALFALASLACALAPSIELLVLGRCVQGVGGALALPGSLALISASYEGVARGRAIGTWSAFSAITTAIGPLIGGWLVQTASWRYVFVINLPLAMLVLVVVRLRVSESRDETIARRVVVPGAFFATAGLGALVYGLIRLQGQRGDIAGFAATVAGLLALGLFAWWERRAPEPMLRLGLFRSRVFTVTNLYTLLLYAALGGGLYFLPFELINVRGYSPEATGAAFLPFILIMFALSRFSGGLVARVGVAAPLVFGALVSALGYIALALAPNGSYWTTIFPAAVLLGLGAAGFVAPLTTAVLGSVPVEHAGVASGVNNAVARTAGLIAIALFGIALTMKFDAELTRAIGRDSLQPTTAAKVARERDILAAGHVPADIDPRDCAVVVDEVKRAFTAGFSLTMLLCATLAGLAALMTFVFLRKPAGATEISHPVTLAGATGGRDT